MYIDFLTEEQKSCYGCFTGEPTLEQLSCYFHLDDTDLGLIFRCRGNHNQMGFALQIVTVRFLGTFLSNPIDVPSGVIAYLSQQLHMESGQYHLQAYMDREQTRHDHRNEIQSHYGYVDFPLIRFRMIRWLYNRVWLFNERPSLLFDLSTSWLVERKVLLPGVITLMRLIVQIRERAEARVWNYLSKLPSEEQRNKLGSLEKTEKIQRLLIKWIE